jgi:hypothetical protein
MVNAGLQLSFRMSKQIAPFALETFGCQTFVSKRIYKSEIRNQIAGKSVVLGCDTSSCAGGRSRTFGGANG